MNFLNLTEKTMNDKISTREHNIDVLYNLGFKKFKNTTVFKKGEQDILSPAVSENSNGRYWFDVREVNLNRINKNEAILFVKIVPDLFIIEHLKNLSRLFGKEVMDNRPKSGNVWSIYLEFDKSSNKAFIFNIKDSNNKFSTLLLNKVQTVKYLQESSK